MLTRCLIHFLSHYFSHNNYYNRSNLKHYIILKIIMIYSANGIKARINLVSEKALGSNNIVKDVFGDMSVYSTKRVIQEVDVQVLVHRSGQTHSLLLTATQIYPLKYQ